MNRHTATVFSGGSRRRTTIVGSAALVTIVAITFFAAPLPAQEFQKEAERLSIVFDNGQFSLRSRTNIQKTIPPTDTLPEGAVSGFWYELRSSEDTVRYRRIIGDPIRLVFEGPDIDTPGSTIPDRKEGIRDRRIFSVLIPSSGPGDQLVIFGVPFELGAQAEPSRELGRISLAPIVE